MSLSKHLAKRLAATAAAVTVAALVPLTATPASATTLPTPPSPTCNPNTEKVWDEVVSAQVDPVVTEFIGFTVAPNTTGTYEKSLARVDSVSTTVNSSRDFSADFSGLFVKVGVKTSLSVITTKATTETETVTVTQNFNKDGRYGLYRGTRKVAGQFVRYTCARTGPTTGLWINTNPNGTGTYTTFADIEIGTVVCTHPEPAGSLSALAWQRIGNC
ncbi:hypothetical protein [Streptomyces sp. NRRL S-495]|uniref:hypothetical protein n=1 Tax=Streptomyces sp. NRRL S-495 TaxID=1609133 RepID=UPI0005F8F614|nr:hypothetical protein [Streptomyces sp. NRRL S-495]KJY25447.1 hypothetical protein VR45_39300 [Streptomyces sp. NRRL S-495]